MTRKNTNKQYSLRKLKKGTASVAVALCVLGAGLTNQTEVKAQGVGRFNEDQIREARDKVLKEMFDDYTGATSKYNTNGYKRKTPTELSNLMQGMYRDLLAKKEELSFLNDVLSKTIDKKIESDNANKQRIGQLKQEIKDLQEAMQGVADTLSQASRKVGELSAQNNALQAEAEAAAQKALAALNNKNAQIAKLVNDNDSLKEAIEGYVDTIQQASREVSAKQEELAAAQLQLEAKNAEIENLKLQDNMKAEEIAKLESEAKILENLIGSGKRELGDLEAKLADANAQKAKLESEAVILENLIGSGKREIADLQAKLDAANADNAKLIEEKQILEASRKRTNRDLEAARNAKKEVDAELAKLKAEAEALKEQLAKQAQEIEKLKDSKEASPKAPEAPKTPEKPEVTPKDSGKSTMPWTALTPAKPIAKANMSSTDAKKDSHQLPSTGEAANPFFTAAAMSVMASAGVLALKRKEEN
uniref:M-like protein SCM-2 n=1 Tax=Streptococcus canis TaxID=1329 RepID=UPI00242BD07D|nr:M-like protein SCM-2 [Streptococcus canis]